MGWAQGALLPSTRRHDGTAGTTDPMPGRADWHHEGGVIILSNTFGTNRTLSPTSDSTHVSFLKSS